MTVHDVVDLKYLRANIQIRPRDEDFGEPRKGFIRDRQREKGGGGGFTLSDRGTISALEALSPA